MKKLLLLGAAALLATSSAMADSWYLIGEFNGWTPDTALEFEGTGNDLSVTVPNFTPSFKIISQRGWGGTEYGAPKNSIAIELNTPSQLISDNAHNVVWPLGVSSITNAIVKWNPSTATVEVVAEENNLTYGYPELYVTGSYCNWEGPGGENTFKMTEKDGIFTAEVNFPSENVEFKIANSGWHYEISGGAAITEETASILTYNSIDNLSTSLTGNLTLTFNANTMLATFGDPDLTLTEPDPVWAIVGSFTNWGDGTPIIFEGEGNELSCTIEKMTTGFKIVPYDNSVINWDYAYSTSTPVEVGKTYELTGRNGGDEIPNIEFGGNILYVENATVTWNPSSAELTITGTAVTGMPTLYVVGGFALNENGGWAAPGESGSILCEQVDGIYTAKVNLGENELVEFKLAGEGWSNEIAGGVTVGYDPVTVTKGGENLKTELTGEQTLVFIYDEMTMYFVDPNAEVTPTPPPTGGDEGGDEPDGPTGAVNSLGVDFENAVYYNLQGTPVANPHNGIFIVKQGDKTYKVVIK